MGFSRVARPGESGVGGKRILRQNPSIPTDRRSRNLSVRRRDGARSRAWPRCRRMVIYARGVEWGGQAGHRRTVNTGEEFGRAPARLDRRRIGRPLPSSRPRVGREEGRRGQPMRLMRPLWGSMAKRAMTRAIARGIGEGDAAIGLAGDIRHLPVMIALGQQDRLGENLGHQQR